MSHPFYRMVAFGTCLTFLMLGAITPLQGQPVSLADPAEVSVSPERLQRVQQLLDGFVSRGELAGLVAIVARQGKVIHLSHSGMADLERGRAMRDDTIFRIYSMTKPITSVALMMLYEEGRFQLDDPVARYIPAFEGLQVYQGGLAANPDLESPARPMQVRDLLTHTSGLTYGFFSETPVDSLYREVNPLQAETLDGFIARLSTLPLLFDPGERWHYSVATDVLGYLVEQLSGQPFDVFLRERLFEPLGMIDTGFHVPPEKHERFAANYTPDGQGGLTLVDDPVEGSFSRPATFFSGGGGLVSTASDYMRFAQMLLNGGKLDGRRYLGVKTVDLMATNFLDGEYAPGYGFGLGVQVRTDLARGNVIGSIGEYGWSGAANTHLFIDPEEELIGIVFTQLFPFGYYPLARRFRVAVYQALTR